MLAVLVGVADDGRADRLVRRVREAARGCGCRRGLLPRVEALAGGEAGDARHVRVDAVLDLVHLGVVGEFGGVEVVRRARR